MTSKRFIPWTDMFLFGGIGLFSVIVSFLVTLNDSNSWVGKLIIWAVTLTFLGVAAFVIYGKFATRPDFITRHGVAVWKSGVEEVTPELMEKAFEDYAALVVGKTVSGKTVTRKSLDALYQKIMVEWSCARVSSIGNGWFIKDAAGLTKDHGILVWWPGTVSSSALFHEIHHIVWREILGEPSDHNHMALEWWDIIKE